MQAEGFIVSVRRSRQPMSGQGQSRRFGDVCDMSAPPPTTAVMMQCCERQKGARKRHMHRSKTALLFDHVVCALLEKSSLPCSLDCAE